MLGDRGDRILGNGAGTILAYTHMPPVCTDTTHIQERALGQVLRALKGS